MDAVKDFNAELCSLYDLHPPITKAKMNQITKAAIRALKFYKHVVQSVEKFIQKCRQEYKVPGLYIIDSIIRCSRKQFGPDKDMFAPRFSKNIVITFHNLFECPQEDISKMIRVLNLWQKNGVYHPGIIQPLLDLASDPHNPAVFETVQKQVEQVTGLTPSMPLKCDQKPPALTADALQLGTGLDLKSDLQGDFSKVLNQLMQSMAPVPPLTLTPQQMQLQLLQQLLVQQLPVPMAAASTPLLQNNLRLPSTSALSSTIDNSLVGQIQMLTQQLLGQAPIPSVMPSVATVAYSENQQKQQSNRGHRQESENEDDENEEEEPREMTSLDKRILYMCQEEDDKDNASVSYEKSKHDNRSRKHGYSKRSSHNDDDGERNASEPGYGSDAEPVSSSPTTPDHGSSERSSQRSSNYGDDRDNCAINNEDGDVGDRMANKTPLSNINMRDDEDIQNGSGMDDGNESQFSDARDSRSGHRSDGSRKSRRKRSRGESKSHKRMREYDDIDGEVESHRGRKSKHKSRSVERPPKHKKSERSYSPVLQDELVEKSRHKKRHREKHDSRGSNERERVIKKSREESRRSDIYEKVSKSHCHKHVEDEHYSSSKSRNRNASGSRTVRSPDKKRKRIGYTVEYGINEDDGDDDDVIFVDMQKKPVDVSRFLEKKLPSLKFKRKYGSRSSSRGSSVEFISQDGRSNREREGMPPIKLEMMSICSTTLWIGHLNKLTSEEELKAELTEFGEATINLVPPRGCAFICLSSRKDAYRALNRLKVVTIQGSQLKVAWAAGVGIKNSTLCEKYDIDLGVTYIPWSRISALDLPALLEGSFADEGSFPPNFNRECLTGKKSKKKKKSQPAEGGNTADATIINPSLIPLPQSLPPLPSVPPPPLPPITDSSLSSKQDLYINPPNINIPPLPLSTTYLVSTTSLAAPHMPSISIHSNPPIGLLKDFPPVSFDPSVPPPSLSLVSHPPKDNIQPGPLSFLPPTSIRTSGMMPPLLNVASESQHAILNNVDNSGQSVIPVLINSHVDVTTGHQVTNASHSLLNSSITQTPLITGSSAHSNVFDKPPPNLGGAAILPISSASIMHLPTLSQVVMVDKPPPQIGLLPQAANFVVQRSMEHQLNISGCILRPFGHPMNNLDQSIVNVGRLVNSQVIGDGNIPLKEVVMAQEPSANQLRVGRGGRPNELVIPSNVILPSLNVLPVHQLRPNLLQPPPSPHVATITSQETLNRLPVPSEFLRRLGASESSALPPPPVAGNSSKPHSLLSMPPVNVPPPALRIHPSSPMINNSLLPDPGRSVSSNFPTKQSNDDPQMSVPRNLHELSNQASNMDDSGDVVNTSTDTKPRKQPLLETPIIRHDSQFSSRLPHPSQILNLNHPAYNNLDLLKKGFSSNSGEVTLPLSLNVDRFRTPRPPKLGPPGEQFEKSPSQQNANVILNFQGTPSTNPTEILISEAIKSLSPLIRIQGAQDCAGFMRTPLINPASFLAGPRMLSHPEMPRFQGRSPGMRGPSGFKQGDRRNNQRPGGHQRSPSRQQYSSSSSHGNNS